MFAQPEFPSFFLKEAFKFLETIQIKKGNFAAVFNENHEPGPRDVQKLEEALNSDRKTEFVLKPKNTDKTYFVNENLEKWCNLAKWETKSKFNLWVLL